MENPDFMADDWNELDDAPLNIGQNTSVHGARDYLENEQKASGNYCSEVKGDAHSHMAVAQPVPSPGDDPTLNLPSIERYCGRARMKPNRAAAKMNPESAMISKPAVRMPKNPHKG